MHVGFKGRECFKRDPFRCIVDFKSACIFASRLRWWRNFKNAHFTWRDYTAQPQTRGPYIDLKPLNEDGNCQVFMYGMHAQKVASEAPGTHFRTC